MHPAFMIKPENASPPESPDPGDPPEPMTPPDCDLRGMPFLPLDVVRLADSDFAALSTGEEFKAAVLLWCRAWNQLPVASLSSDERALARLSGAGRRWPLVREMALHGFVLCADGQLEQLAARRMREPELLAAVGAGEDARFRLCQVEIAVELAYLIQVRHADRYREHAM